MSSQPTLSSINPLVNKDGYGVWKFKMRMYLLHEELWEAVVGYAPGAVISADKMIRNDQKALTKICLTVDGLAINHVRSCRTAKEAWEALSSAYEDKGIGRRISLERKLYRLCLLDFDNVEMYINAVMSTVLDLADIGKVIEDASIAAILLGGLTPQYDPLVMALENSNIEITTALVKTKLLNEHNKDKPDSALRTRYSQKHKPSTSKFKKPIVCYDCKEPGHKRPDCPYKKKNNIQGGLVTSFTALTANDEKWFIDSGASAHMSSRVEWMENLRDCPTGKVTIANGEQLLSGGIGNISISSKNGNLTIHDVVNVPNLNSNLISVKKAVDKGYCIVFDKTGCNFYDSTTFSCTGDSMLHGSICGGMYTLDCTVNLPKLSAFDVHSDVIEYRLWHRRLGHLCRIGMDQLKKGQALGISYSGVDKDPCIPCIEGKQNRKPFKNISYERATSVLQLVHSDLCGPMQETSFLGNKYALFFIDDFSRMIFVFFISSKADVKNKFKVFQSLVERETGAKIKAMRSDNGSEYVNNDFLNYLQSVGIQHQTTVPHNPQQNGISERTNRSIIEKARSLLSDSSLSKAYWQDAVATAVYLKNRSPHRALIGKTPFEMWFGDKPDLSHLRVFGCRALVYVPECHRKKLDLKATEHIFVGYSECTKIYLFRDVSCPRRLVKGRDVVFFEDTFQDLKTKGDMSQPVTSVSRVSDGPQQVKIPLFSQSQDNNTESLEEPTASTSTGNVDSASTQSTPVLKPSEQNVSDVELAEPRYNLRSRKLNDGIARCVCMQSSSYLKCDGDDEPTSYLQAVHSEDKDDWYCAMKDEYQSLLNKNTWVLVDRPDKKAILPCKWVYKLKRNAQGDIMKYKARLVAKGYNQTYGVDYFETFSPVVRNSSLRMLFALAAEMDLRMHHLDVDTAFLNGDIEEEVYMCQPQGFIEHGQEDKVCLLKRSIYGLKQAARAWNIKLNDTLSLIGFMRTSSEQCIYVKRCGIESSTCIELVILAVYVDDIIIFYKEDKSLDAVIFDLNKCFSLKVLGKLNYCLGLNVQCENNEIKLSQHTYIKELLRRYGMTDCKTVSTPLENNKLLPSEDGEQCSYPYQNLIGCLMFLAVSTRPDIAYATSYLSQFNTKYNKSHWMAAKRVLQYLKGTIDYCINYRKGGGRLFGFADADWANCVIDRRSYTGFYFSLSGGPISWECKKQPTVALSSSEAEYMSLSSAAKDAVYLRRLLCELTGIDAIVDIYNDSQSAQKIALNPVHHNRTKHIDTKFHYIRQLLIDKVINVLFISSDQMYADVLTKALCRQKHMKCLQGMGISV